MLADELVADKALPRICPGFDAVQDQIRRAQKFALAQDFALAADGVVANNKELVNIAPFCRLPYPITWFEFAQSARTHWVDAPMHHPDFQSHPRAVGFLCVALNKELTRWSTILCWALKPNELKFGSNEYNASIISCRYDVSMPQERLEDYTKVIRAPFINASLIPLMGTDAMTPDVIERLGSILQSDWAGEVRYLLAILALLNARNVAEKVSVDLTKLNRSRKRSGKLPFFEHHTLKIRSTLKPALTPSLNGRAHSGELRSCFVRGHWKRRKTGLFFWGPYCRGNIKHGFVQKTYVVTT